MTRTLPKTLIFIAALAHLACALAGNDPKIALTSKHSKPKHTRTAGSPSLPKVTPQGTPYGNRADVLQQAQDIAQRRDLDPEWVSHALAQAHYLPGITKLMLPPAQGTAKNWRVYRSRFVEPMRIAAGVKYWQNHRDWLQRAEQTYGIPPEIVVGIIGVETIYGQQMGHFRVIDALATLAFDFPQAHPRAAARQAFFQAELEQFLSLSSRMGNDPLAARGSYAGAMGMPQFMPSSWVKFAVDFDGDGKIDLFNSPADAIGSVANYFRSFGWQPGMPTHYGVQFDTSRLDMDALMAPDILPTFSPARMATLGAIVDAPGATHTGPLALIELQNGTDAVQYVAGTENFYTITRYNWSSYYAMAVIELGQAVKGVMLKNTALSSVPITATTATAPTPSP